MAAITARPYIGLFTRMQRPLATSAAIAVWVGVGLVLVILAFVWTSQALGWRLVDISEDIPGAPSAGSLGVFEGVPSHGLYRGDVVLYQEPDGERTVRRVAALAADGNLVLEGPAGAESSRSAPGDFRGLFLFAIPLIGPLGSWAASPIGAGALMAIVVVFVITLATRRILSPRRAGLPHGNYIRTVRRRIVSYSHVANEDASVKFPPLRRQRHSQTAEASTSPVIERLTQAVHFVEAPAAEPAPAINPAGESPPPSSTGFDFGDPGTPGATLRLRSQYSAADARTDRLVRQMRDEVEDLRQSLEMRAEVPAAEPDIAAILADPGAAADLPPAFLVRALQAANERHAELLAELEHARKRSSKLKAKLRKRRTKQAANDARFATLQDVIAALHANLEDLRLERDNAYRLAPGPRPFEQMTTPTRFPTLAEHD